MFQLRFNSKRERYFAWYTSILEKCGGCIYDKVVLEVGGGEGEVTAFMRKKNAKAFVLDIDEAAMIRGPAKEWAMAADSMAIPFPNESVDLIVAFEVVEHLSDPYVALQEFERILKPNGTLILTTPTPRSKDSTMPEHVSIKPRHEWIKLLKSLGFDVEIVTYFYPMTIRYLPQSFNNFVGKMLGIWKRYLDVTSAKLVATKLENN